MSSISLNDNSPKVFGYLYVAVFSNGTVKAGRSARDPQGRVTTHANSGKAFDIHLDSAFYASIYTNDASTREKLMHQELGLLARLTTGKEWFKFEDATAAVNFASAYLCKVERMSFAERPSAEELAAREQARKKPIEGVLLALFPTLAPAVTLLAPASNEELQKMESMLHEYSPSIAISMARKIMDYEDFLAQTNDNFDSGLPILIEAIEKGWDDALSMLADPDDFQSRCDAVGSISFDSAVRTIKAAANYPNFFFEALRSQEVQA